jgi:hypothetical protein
MTSVLTTMLLDVIDLTSLSSDDDISGNENEESIPDHVRAQLQVAISTAPETRLRAIVTKLSSRIPEMERALIRELVTIPSAGTTKDAKKNVTLRWEICGNCREDFDVSKKRRDGECLYHHGEKKECPSSGIFLHLILN